MAGEPGRILAFGRRVETIAALTMVALLAVGCVVVLRPFFSALLWAIILTYSTWPAYAWLERRLHHRPSLAALIMTLLLALAFILPLALVASTLGNAVTALIDALRGLLESGPPPPPDWVVRLPLVGPDVDDAWRQFTSNTTEFAAFMKPYLADARGWAVGAGLTAGHAVAEISLSVFSAFFLYRDGAIVVERVRRIGHRLVGDRVHHLLLVTSATIRGVVYGTVGSAGIQGVLAGIGFRIAGVPAPLFLASLTFLFGLVPGGPPLIWISVSIWLAAIGRLGWAVFMAVWGFLLISGIENFIKPYLISRESSLPLLLVFLGVIGGALGFGFIGVFLGPILLGVAFALVVDWTAAAVQVPESPLPDPAARANPAAAPMEPPVAPPN